MYHRTIAPILTLSRQKYPILTLIGPRQSGKTTLVRQLFPEHSYHSLEDPDVRRMAKADPRGFLASLSAHCIIDEVQRVPELTSYIQTIIDEPTQAQLRHFILTGSNALMLIDSITQSLAGRTEIFELFPLSVAEIQQKHPLLPLNQFLFQGGYPRIYQQDLNPTKWYKNYFQLYVEKDVRQIGNISNIDLFEKCVRLTAGRVGQLVNASGLANEVGVSSPTISSWLAALKTTFICFTLQPHFKNFNKRMIKSPKIYFYDTGLLCYLLGITDADQLEVHPLRGQIFENFIISELFKLKTNAGQEPSYYFWRDQKGHEVDLVEDRSTYLFPIEIKMSQTFHPDFISNINYLNELQQRVHEPQMGQVIYTGTHEGLFQSVHFNHWRQVLD